MLLKSIMYNCISVLQSTYKYIKQLFVPAQLALSESDMNDIIHILSINNIEYHALNARYVGNDICISLHMNSDGKVSITDAYIKYAVMQNMLRKRFRNAHISVSFDSEADD